MRRGASDGNQSRTIDTHRSDAHAEKRAAPHGLLLAPWQGKWAGGGAPSQYWRRVWCRAQRVLERTRRRADVDGGVERVEAARVKLRLGVGQLVL